MLRRYRIPRRRSRSAAGGGEKKQGTLDRDAMLEQAIGTLLLVPLAVYFSFPGMVQCGVEVAAPVPPYPQVVLHMVGMVVGCDTLFYWTHRTLHHPLLYQKIHKQHHQYTSTNVWASEYFGVVDMVLNILPGVVPALLMGAHFYTLLLFTALRQWQTVQSHAGYDLPFDPLNRGIFHGKVSRA